MKIKFQKIQVSTNQPAVYFLGRVRHALQTISCSVEDLSAILFEPEPPQGTVSSMLSAIFSTQQNPRNTALSAFSVELGYREFVFYHRYQRFLEDNANELSYEMSPLVKTCLLRSMALVLSAKTLAGKHGSFAKFVRVLLTEFNIYKDDSALSAVPTRLVNGYEIKPIRLQESMIDLGERHREILFGTMPWYTEQKYKASEELVLMTELSYQLRHMLCTHLLALIADITAENQFELSSYDTLFRHLKLVDSESWMLNHGDQAHEETLNLSRIVESIRNNIQIARKLKLSRVDIQAFIDMAELLLEVVHQLEPATDYLHMLENPGHHHEEPQGEIHYPAISHVTAGLAQRAIVCMQGIDFESRPKNLHTMNEAGTRDFDSATLLINKLWGLATNPSAVQQSTTRGQGRRPNGITALSWSRLIQHGWLAQMFGITLAERQYVGLQGAELNLLQLEACNRSIDSSATKTVITASTGLYSANASGNQAAAATASASGNMQQAPASKTTENDKKLRLYKY